MSDNNYYQEQFQKETLRTSKLAVALKEAAQVLIGDGHDVSAYARKKCARCDVLGKAMDALKETVYYNELMHQIGHRSGN